MVGGSQSVIMTTPGELIRALAFVSTVHAYTGAQIHKMWCWGVEDRGGLRENAGDPIVATMTGYFQYLYPLTQVLKAPADTSVALNSGWGQFVLRQTTRAAHASPSLRAGGRKSAEGVDGTVLTRPIWKEPLGTWTMQELVVLRPWHCWLWQNLKRPSGYSQRPSFA